MRVSLALMLFAWAGTAGAVGVQLFTHEEIMRGDLIEVWICPPFCTGIELEFFDEFEPGLVISTPYEILNRGWPIAFWGARVELPVYSASFYWTARTIDFDADPLNTVGDFAVAVSDIPNLIGILAGCAAISWLWVWRDGAYGGRRLMKLNVFQRIKIAFWVWRVRMNARIYRWLFE